MKGQKVMGKKHRLLHRRLAAESSYPTIANVVATVDQNRSAIAVHTVSSLPTVPAVPPFPSDLTVPAVPRVTSVALPSVSAYLFTSTSTTTAAPSEYVQAMGATSQIVLSSPPSTPLLIASSVASGERNSTTITTSFPTTVTTGHSSSAIGRNSTISSNMLSFTGLPFNRNSTTVSASRHSSSVHVTSSASQTSSSEVSSSVANSASSAAPAGVGGFGIPGGVAAASSTPTAATGNGPNHPSNNSISTPQVVGSVIGSLAGLTVLLVLALLILRRYKRKQRALQHLSETDTADTRPIASAGQQMAQRSSFMPAAAASFLSRFSSSSRGTVDPGGAPGQERGFQRISGRKLPSAFSEGMTSDSVPFDRATLSGSSFYRDSQGFYRGSGAATATATNRSHHVGVEKEKLMPSPARTPVVHHPEEYPPLRDPVVPSGALQSSPQSPQSEPRGTLGRSHPSHDGSRGSKFAEVV